MKAIQYKELKTLENSQFGLSLRPIRDEDTDNIVRWRNSDFVKEQFVFRGDLTKETHRKWLQEKVYTGDAIQFVIILGDESIGTVYVRDINLENRSGEFGIYIGETNKVAKGVGTETTRMILSYCFELGFHRIFLRVLSKNERAKKCYLKAGFSYEGTAKDMVYVDNQWLDVDFMSIINPLELEKEKND